MPFFDAPHVHLLVNHFPIILTILGLGAAIIALLTRRRGAWVYAVATLTLSGLTAFPVDLTGDYAADVMKHKWYVVKDSIKAHDNMAGITMWILIVMGVVSAYAWWRLARRGADASLPAWLRALIVALAVAGTATGSYAAYLGGQIVYGSPRLLTAPSGGALPAGPVDPAHPAAGAVGP
jgi:uncharacterized membrane protein